MMITEDMTIFVDTPLILKLKLVSSSRFSCKAISHRNFAAFLMIKIQKTKDQQSEILQLY